MPNVGKPNRRKPRARNLQIKTWAIQDQHPKKQNWGGVQVKENVPSKCTKECCLRAGGAWKGQCANRTNRTRRHEQELRQGWTFVGEPCLDCGKLLELLGFKSTRCDYITNDDWRQMVLNLESFFRDSVWLRTVQEQSQVCDEAIRCFQPIIWLLKVVWWLTIFPG